MTNNIQNSELNGLITKTEMLRILECPVCQEIPFPPIFQCTRGHNICKNCKPKLKECPTCRGTFSEARNFTVEQMVLAAQHTCPYKEDGCPIEQRGEMMENHMNNNCSYRPFKCPWFGNIGSGCSTNLLRLSLAKDHVVNVHVAEQSCGSPTTIVDDYICFKELCREGPPRRLKRTTLWAPDSIEFDGKLFFLYTFGMTHSICFTVLCLGSEEDAQKYRVKIICQPDKDMEMQWTAPVNSIMKGAELMNIETRYNVFIPSCTLDDLIQIAEIDEVKLKYRFSTSYTILKR